MALLLPIMSSQMPRLNGTIVTPLGKLSNTAFQAAQKDYIGQSEHDSGRSPYDDRPEFVSY